MESIYTFSEALEMMKKGAQMKRLRFGDTCFIKAQYPTETSMNTLPYLIMYKRQPETAGYPSSWDVFPFEPSCESIFAEDWIVVEEPQA